MKNIKRIVVGLDIFDKSNKVLKRALLLAETKKAELFVINAVETPWFSMPSFFGSEDIKVDIEGTVDKIDKQIKKLNKDLNVPTFVVVKEGNPVDILLYEAKLLKADMIVIGTQSKKKVLGSTVEKVVHQSHLPVLVVKNAVKGSYKNIVAPTDFERQSKLSIMFAKRLFSKVNIKPVHSLEEIYIDGPYSIMDTDLTTYNRTARVYAQQALNELAKDLSLQKGKILDGALNNKKALITYLNKSGYDLVVLGSQGTSGVSALLGSMALSIVRETSTDVLVYVP